MKHFNSWVVIALLSLLFASCESEILVDIYVENHSGENIKFYYEEPNVDHLEYYRDFENGEKQIIFEYFGMGSTEAFMENSDILPINFTSFTNGKNYELNFDPNNLEKWEKSYNPVTKRGEFRLIVTNNSFKK